MAVLRQQVSTQIIQAFRGIIDFYCWKGKKVARAWPHRGPIPFTDKQKETWDKLRRSHDWKKAQPPVWHYTFESLSMPSEMSYEDAKRKTALKLAYADALRPTPSVIAVDTAPGSAPSTTEITITFEPYDGFDPNDITWRVRPYSDDSPQFQWVPNTIAKDPRGNPIIRYTPDLQPFVLPTSEAVSVPLSTYTLTIQGLYPAALVLPQIDLPSAAELMAGPPYDSALLP